MEHGSPLRLDDGSHVVQFYDDDQDLVRVVGAYLAAALLDGETVLVVATQAHGEAFRAGLRAAGVDVPAAVATGQLVLRDADDTLAEFMVAGAPSAVRYDATVGSLVRQLGQKGRPVRAYGEMVARLWQDNNVAGAVQLEGLWNELAERTPFGLFCAYPLELMTDTSVCEAFDAVCDLHSHVLAGPPDSPAESSRRFVGGPHAARLARRYVDRTLREWGYTAVADDALIAVGELVANAIQHGGGHFGVGLTRTPQGVRVMVGDSSPAPPTLGRPASLDLGGRGLRMVETVGRGWGHEVSGAGKVVWVELGGQPQRGDEAVSP